MESAHRNTLRRILYMVIIGGPQGIAYQPENTLASRFASYLQNMHFDEEYSEMETLIID